MCRFSWIIYFGFNVHSGELDVSLAGCFREKGCVVYASVDATGTDHLWVVPAILSSPPSLGEWRLLRWVIWWPLNFILGTCPKYCRLPTHYAEENALWEEDSYLSNNSLLSGRSLSFVTGWMGKCSAFDLQGRKQPGKKCSSLRWFESERHLYVTPHEEDENHYFSVPEGSES